MTARWTPGAQLQATVPGRALGHDPDDIRSRAEEIVSNPPYTETGDGLIAQALDWLGDRIASLLAGSGLGAVGPLLAWALAAIGIGVLVIVVWRLTRGTVLGRPTSAPVPGLSTRRTAAAWHADADAYEAQGRRTDALRARYGALVVGLIERGTLDDLPGRTVGELDLEVARAEPALASLVADAGRRFERGVYGGLPVTDDDLARVREGAWAVAAASGPRAGVLR